MNPHPQNTKAKAAPNEEFQAACSLWRMQFAFHSFLAVRAGIDSLLERKVHSDEPEYYPMSVGLICLYARPFTNNQPVGPPAEDIIPPNEVFLIPSQLSNERGVCFLQYWICEC
jgi:hypothetical protein